MWAVVCWVCRAYYGGDGGVVRGEDSVVRYVVAVDCACAVAAEIEDCIAGIAAVGIVAAAAGCGGGWDWLCCIGLVACEVFRIHSCLW